MLTSRSSRRTLSVALSTALLVGLAPALAFAQSPGEDAVAGLQEQLAQLTKGGVTSAQLQRTASETLDQIDAALVADPNEPLLTTLRGQLLGFAEVADLDLGEQATPDAPSSAGDVTPGVTPSPGASPATTQPSPAAPGAPAATLKAEGGTDATPKAAGPRSFEPAEGRTPPRANLTAPTAATFAIQPAAAPAGPISFVEPRALLGVRSMNQSELDNSNDQLFLQHTVTGDLDRNGSPTWSPWPTRRRTPRPRPRPMTGASSG